MILVTGSFTTQQAHLAAALALSVGHVHRSRAEPGCISHAVLQDAENPLRLVFVEQWADRATLAAHFALPASRAFAKSVASLSVAPPQINVFEASRVVI